MATKCVICLILKTHRLGKGLEKISRVELILDLRESDASDPEILLLKCLKNPVLVFCYYKAKKASGTCILDSH